jgi:tetratricopeptide (TPR) repeat protein
MKKIIIALFIIQFWACSSSQKFMKQAAQLSSEGNYSDAADNYYTVLLNNPKNLEAKIGLRKNAQLVLDEKFATFAKLVVEGSSEKALRQFFYCKDYYNNLNKIGIELDWQAHFDALYEETKQEFIAEQYKIGLNLMLDNKHDKAQIAFNKILEFDSSYQNVSVLRIQSIVEPLYKQGTKYLELGKYNLAYKQFEDIMAFDKNYKDVHEKMLFIQQKINVPIATILTGNTKFDKYQDIAFCDVLIAKLSKSKNPFLQVIDRKNLEKILQEQELGMSGIVDANTASKAGKIIGAKYFLLINVYEVNTNELKPTTTQQTAYQAESERVATAGGETQSVIKFKKVNYAETKKYRKVEAKIGYQLVSVQSGQIVSAEVFNGEQFDVHLYARYSGNIDNLYPNLPAGNFMPSAPTEWKDQFFELNRDLLSIQALTDKVFEEISLKILDDIELFIQ